jgi:splicing factor 3B subunit 3
VVSFLNATIVLAIGETVEEVHDTGFLDKTSTLSASTIGDDCLLQVWSVPLIVFLRLGRHNVV